LNFTTDSGLVGEFSVSSQSLQGFPRPVFFFGKRGFQSTES
jgi:hypothetical protein